jgi:RNA polymerase sigma factor (sigma-70 family)
VPSRGKPFPSPCNNGEVDPFTTHSMAQVDARQPAEDRIARWVREHGRAVRGYLLGMVRQADAADDLLQEVFQRAWQSRDRYREEGHERAFLLRIADRLVIDRGRRLGVEVNVDETMWHDVEPAAQTEMPLDTLSRVETADELAAALDRLTAAQKRVLLLRFFGDLTFEEIASSLGCPLGTALSHCRRGLLAMRKQLTANPS